MSKIFSGVSLVVIVSLMTRVEWLPLPHEPAANPLRAASAGISRMSLSA